MSEENQQPPASDREGQANPVQETSEDWNTFDESFFIKAHNDQLKIIDKTTDGVMKKLANETKPKQVQQTCSSTPSKLNASNSTQSNKTKYKLSHQSRKCKFEGIKETTSLDISASKIKVLEQVEQADKKCQSSENGQPKQPSIIPPIVDSSNLPQVDTEDKALASMLMAWYMAGYHTGHYDAMKRKQTN